MSKAHRDSFIKISLNMLRAKLRVRLRVVEKGKLIIKSHSHKNVRNGAAAFFNGAII
jgi:hypothetical protein